MVYNASMAKPLAKLLVTVLLTSQALMLAFGAHVHSPVLDEIAHLAAGIGNWELARFDLYKVNPPLVRMLAALPALAAGAETDYGSYSLGVGVRAEFPVMEDFTRANGRRVLWLVTLARWALIPLALLGGYVCYRWARELYGDAAGILALALWCFSPNVLAYGQVINADAAAAALGVTAAYFFWKWLRQPAWDRAIVAGIALGLAELTKTTWVVLFALWPLLAIMVRCQSSKGSRRFRSQLTQLAVVLALAALSINACYDFEGSGTKLRNYVFASRPLTGGASVGRGGRLGNRFAEGWIGNLPVPLPKNYLEGIDLQWHDIEHGKPSYLRGRWRERGWWYWYLYALTVKVPLGTWGLFLLAVATRVAGWRRGIAKCKSVDAVSWRDEFVLLAPAAAVLVLVSSQTGFSRYVRYVLPIFPFVFIWISGLLRGPCERNATARALNRRGRLVTVSAVIFLSWSAGSSLWFAPHWMSYFNELAGGPTGGPAHLIDAQVDWGQDLLYLKEWLDARPDAQPLGLAYFGSIHPTVAGVEFLLPPNGVIVMDEGNALGDSSHAHPSPVPKGETPAPIAGVPGGLRPGWYAVSVNFLYGYPQRLYGPSGEIAWANKPFYSYFRRFRPVATAGYSIYIYHLTTDEIEAARAEPETHDGHRTF